MMEDDDEEPAEIILSPSAAQLLQESHEGLEQFSLQKLPFPEPEATPPLNQVQE